MYTEPDKHAIKSIRCALDALDRLDPCDRRYGHHPNAEPVVDDYIDPIIYPVAEYLHAHQGIPAPQWYADLANARGELLRGNIDAAKVLLEAAIKPREEKP